MPAHAVKRVDAWVKRVRKEAVWATDRRTGGDVSAGSMSAGDSSTESLYRHCIRLTNYSNEGDSVLKVSNAKRLGMAPRVGRAGLPTDVPSKAVDVDCTEYVKLVDDDPGVRAEDSVERDRRFLPLLAYWQPRVRHGSVRDAGRRPGPCGESHAGTGPLGAVASEGTVIGSVAALQDLQKWRHLDIFRTLAPPRRAPERV